MKITYPLHKLFIGERIDCKFTKGRIIQPGKNTVLSGILEKGNKSYVEKIFTFIQEKTSWLAILGLLAATGLMLFLMNGQTCRSGIYKSNDGRKSFTQTNRLINQTFLKQKSGYTNQDKDTNN